MYKKIIKKHRTIIGIGILIALLSSILYVGAGYSLSMIYTEDNTVKATLIRSAVVLAIWIVTLVVMYYSDVLQGKILWRLKQYTREDISKKIESLNYSEYSNKDTGNYVAWYTTDVSTVTEQGYKNIFGLAEGLALTVFSFLAMVKFGIWIAVASIVLFAFSFLVPQITGKKLQTVTKENSAVQEKSVERFKDAIQGYEELMLANRTEVFEKKVSNASKDMEEAGFSLYKMTEKVKMLSNGIGLVGQMVLLVVTTIMVGFKIAPVGAVLAVGNLSGTFFNGLAIVIKAVSSMSASNSLMDKFEVDNKVDASENVDKLNKLEIENLNFAYGEEKVLDNVSMSFEKGEKYALVGQSGSGKSTIARILLHEIEDYTGSVKINGKAYSDVKKEAIHSLVGMVSQNVFLFEDTIRNNITLGCDYSNEEVENVLKKVQMLDYVKSLENGVDELVRENGKNYSGGQRQRIAIARALIRKPELIIMDEGTSALDKENAIAIEEILLSTDVTVIFITHHLQKSVEERLKCVYSL